MTDNWKPSDQKKCASIFPDDIDDECRQHCKVELLCSMVKAMYCARFSKEELERKRKLTPAQEIAETLNNIEENTFHNKDAKPEEVDGILDKTQQIRKKLNE